MDLMAAVVILGLFIMPLIMARNNTIIMASEAIGLRQARALMELKLGELELTKDEEVTSDQGEFGEEFPGFTWIVEVESLPLSELVPLTEEEAEEEESLWGFGEPDPEEEEEPVEDVRDRVVLRVTVRVRYPTDVEAPEDAPPLEDGEVSRQPGEIVAIRLIITDQIVGEDGEILAPEEEGEDPPEEGTEGTPQEQPRKLVDLFGPAPGQESEEEE